MVKKANLAYRWLAYGWQYVLRARLYYNLYIKREEPIVILQMGKVSSVSVHKALQAHFSSVYHLHTIDPVNIQQRQQMLLQAGMNPHSFNYTNGHFLREHIAKRNRPIRYVTLVREPISRNLSAFFETFALYMGHSPAETTLTSEQLLEAFLERFPHDRPLTYFDTEYRDILGVDVFAEPFPHEQGYHHIKQRNAELLLLKLETEESVREEALRQFFNVPQLHMPQVNVGTNKSYADVYRTFIREIQLPQDYIDKMLNARYTQHFYTDQERAAIRQRWER